MDPTGFRERDCTEKEDKVIKGKAGNIRLYQAHPLKNTTSPQEVSPVFTIGRLDAEKNDEFGKKRVENSGLNMGPACF